MKKLINRVHESKIVPRRAEDVARTNSYVIDLMGFIRRDS